MPESQENLEMLLGNKVSWLADSGPEDDIALSSRIRLARNIEGIPFPISADREKMLNTMVAVQMAVKKGKCLDSYFEFTMANLKELDRKFLLERRLISREFMANHNGGALIVNRDEDIGVMINEEDHIRIQAMRPGFQIREVWEQINKFDDKFSSELPYAFDNNLGYLTSCPTNVGTGMRASVMLHLPGLVLTNQIHAVIQGVSKLGLAVRGFFGEGTENLGNLYQISNQSTLGESEEQIIDRLSSVIKQIISHEKSARQTLLEKRQNFLLNHIGRAYGILRHAYIISSEETLNSLSALRMGVDMGMFSSIDIHTVNELFVIIQPAHLQKYAKKELHSEERDVFRASLVREKIRLSEKKDK